VTTKRVPLMASVLLHAAVVVLLFALSFPERIPAPALRARAVMLLTPVPVRQVLVAPVEIPRPLRPFHAPTITVTPVPHREVVSAPMIDIPRPMLASPEIRAIAALPAPPLRIDNLASPVVVAPVAAAPGVIRVAGFSEAVSGTQRAAGTVRRAGFGNSSTANAAVTPRLLAHAGFGDATVTPGPGAGASAPVSPVTRPVEILSKPKPVYTEEARGRRIEGEVLLRVLFSASGQVQVLATVRGLGYGLDEQAVAAAEAIHFRPAERAGVAADSTAVMHIVFQLAY